MSYSDELWSCVMNYVIERNPDSKNNWRQVTFHDADCSQCSDGGGGALIQCSTLQCNHEYHLPCAWNTQGSFVLLNETGNLQYECEAHHIPVTFCICKQEYDESLPMISCDDCNEWYHNKCVGLKGEPPETYSCQSCRNIKASGKSIPEDKLKKNREKENRSADVQAGNKAISYLMYLHESVVPIMKNKYVPTLVKYKDINETLNILNTQFVVNEGSILGNNNDNDNDVERFGTVTIIQKWIKQLEECISKVNNWTKGSNNAMSIMLKALNDPNLNVEHISVIDNQIDQLNVWHKHMDELPFIESSTGFIMILDSLKWLIMILQLIHLDDDLSDQQFYNQISNHIKLAPSKLRKLEQCNYEFCHSFSNIFNKYYTKINDMVNSMSFWSTMVEKKISGASSATLGDLEKMLDDAIKNFPRMPLAVDDLREVIDAAKAIDADINEIINDDKMRDLNTCLRTKDNANNVTVIIPSVKKLNLIISFLYFLHDYETNVNSQTRASEENVNELLQRSDINCDDTNTSPLSQNLLKNIENCQKSLKSITNEVIQIKKDANVVLRNQSKVDDDDDVLDKNIDQLLSRFRSYKIFTIEERALDYVTTGKQIISQATSFINDNNKHHQHDLTDVELCYKTMSEMAEDLTADSYALSKTSKGHIISMKEKLFSLLKSAQDLWKDVKKLINNCEHGQTTFQEDFDNCFNTAMTTAAFINTTMINDNNKLREEVLKEIPSVTEKLNAIVDPIKDFDAAKVLLNQIQHLPFPMALSKAVLLRYNVCNLVKSCQEYIDATDDDVELKQYQELRQQLLSSQLTDLEKVMIETVREDFLFKLFKAEYSLSRHQKIAFDEVKIVLTNASAIGEKATKSNEFLEFGAEIDEFDKLCKSIQELLKAVNVEIEQGNNSKKLTKNDDHEEVFNHWQTNLLAIQNKLRDLLASLIQKKFIDTSLEGQLASSMGLLDSILQAINIHREVIRSDRVINANVLPSIQLMQLTSVSNKLKQLLESSSNLSLQRLSSLLSDYHNQAIKLNDYATGLIPQRAKRKKQKAEQVSVVTLEDILKQPIAQVFMLPMRESLIATLEGYHDIKKQIQELVTGKSFRNCEDFNLIENVKDNVFRINEIRQAIDFQPVDIEYTTVLSWLFDVLSWMSEVLLHFGEGDSHEPGSFTYEYAAASIQKAIDLVITIDENVLEILQELGVISTINDVNLDEMILNPGLCIKSATSLMYQLQAYMADTKSFEAEFDHYQYQEFNKTITKDLHSKMINLIVKPKDEVYKTIEAALHKFTRGVTTSGRAIDSDKVRTIYDQDDDEDYENEYYDRDDYKSSAKTDKEPSSSSKKAKTDSDSNSKKVALPVKKEKQKKVTIKCCKPSCHGNAMLHSSYCSDTCALLASESIVSALLTMRIILASSNSIDTNQDLKSLKESFSSKADSLDVNAAINDIALGIVEYQKLILNDKKSLMKVTDKKNMGISSILQCLPSAASFLIKTDHENNDDKDKSFRLDVRYRLEDILITSLLRQGVFGAVSLGAVLAVDFEEELHKKHSSKKDGQKDLKNHYLMLMRNLKQVHNDHLILRLMNSTLKIEDLLNMTDKQFAKEDVQIARAQQRIEAAQKSFVKESVVNTLEKMVGTTMAGNETWRSKDLTIASTPTKDVDEPMDIDTNLASPSIDINEDLNASNNDDNDKSAGDEEKSPDKPNIAPKKVAKRPLDTDAAARYATSAKIPRIEVDEGSGDPNAVAATDKPKEASKILALLKQPSLTSTAPLIKKTSQDLPKVLKLLSSVGTDKFTITRPNGFQFTCTGTVTNKLVQGLLEKSFTVDGKVKVDEFNKFIGSIVDKGKKIVECTRMYPLDNDKGFESFRSEFVQSGRIGLCHISKTSDNKSDGKVSFYILPKSIKSQLPILNRLEVTPDDDVNELLFYGIIISAEPGPDLYVNASPRMYELFTSNSKEAAHSSTQPLSTSPKAAVTKAATAPPKQEASVSSESTKIPPPPQQPSSSSTSSSTVIPSAPPILKKSNPVPSSEMMQKIKKVATFVANQPNGGSAMINKLKGDVRAKTETPFLYEGSEFYSVFIAELKDALVKKK